jgi:hypothetical protein
MLTGLSGTSSIVASQNIIPGGASRSADKDAVEMVTGSTRETTWAGSVVHSQ